MLKFTKEQYNLLLEHVRCEQPLEACGLLGGRIEGEVRTVEKVFLLTNVDHSEEHFSLDPKEQFAAVKEIRQANLQLLGNFHSHPASPARPSEEDKKLAFDPQASYVIISLLDPDNPVCKSFRIAGKQVSEEEIILEQKDHK